MSAQKNSEIKAPTSSVQKSSLINVMEFTVDRVMQLADANSVLGEPIISGGMTIIPVSKLSVGFAGGGADVTDASRRKKQNPAGAGAKVNLTPMTFLVLSEGEVRTVSVNAPVTASGGIAGSLIDTIVSQVKNIKDTKK